MRRYLIIFSLCLFVCSGCQKQLQTSSVSQLPAMYIEIESSQKDSIYADREHRANASMTILSVYGDTLSSDIIKLKTRGNSTFYCEKKSFSFSLPKRKRILGLRKSKSYTLLANCFDNTFMHNAIAFDLAERVGLQSPTYTFVRLYINEEYVGLYQLTDKIKVNKHGLNIADLEKQNKKCNSLPLSEYPWFCYGHSKMHNDVARNRDIGSRKGVILENDPDDISGGYILDGSAWDWIYHKSISGFVSNAGDPIRIRAPKHASEKQTEYIARQYNLMEDAILDCNGINPHTQKHYTEYLDINSFVLYYIINELMENQDAGVASFYMYKDVSEHSDKIFAGPIWDFDMALGGINSEPSSKDYNALYAASMLGNMGEPHSRNLFYHLYRHHNFRERVKQTWFDVVRPIAKSYLDDGNIDSLRMLLYTDAIKETSQFQQSVNELKDFYTNRIKFLDFVWGTPEDNMVCVIAKYNYADGIENDRWVQLYLPKDKPSTIEIWTAEHYNHSPIMRWAYKGTDVKVESGTIFHNGDTIVGQMREPTWKEVQLRRIKKKLHRLFPLLQ